MASNLKDMSWDQVQADPRFTSATPQQKYNIEKAWRASKAPTQVPAQPTPHQTQQAQAPVQAPQETGIVSDVGNTIANFGQGAVAGIGRSLGEGVGGGLKMLEDTLHTGTTYGKRMLEDTRRQYESDLAESGKAGQYGATVGGIAGDIGAMVVAPEIAVPAIAGREFGRAYANQKEGQESVARAALVGGANYWAGRLIPGATGEVAEGLINKGIQVARNAGKGAAIGAKGGAAVGAAEAINADENATGGDIVSGTLHGAGAGAILGGGITGTHSIISNVSNRTAKAATDAIQEVPPVERADLTEQASKVGRAQTAQERADAYKEAAGLRSVKGSAALEARGIPLTDARFRYSPEAAATHGVTTEQIQKSSDASRESTTNAMFPWTNTEAPGKMAVAKSQWERGGRQLVDDVKGSLQSGKDSIDTFERQVSEDFESRAGEASTAEKQANTQNMAAIKTFKKAYADYVRDMNGLSSGESVRTNNLLDSAARAQDAYDAMPDYFKQQFNSDFKNIGEGFQEGFNPVDHAATYIDAFNQLKEMHPSFRNSQTKPSQGAASGVPGASYLDLGSAAIKAFKSSKARSKMVAEQERNANTTRQLAAGLANAERRTTADVANAKANMENPVVDDGTQAQMEYSEPVEAAQAATETTMTPKASPDQGVVYSGETPAQRLRRKAEEQQRAALEAQTHNVVEESAPAIQPEPDRVLTQRPTRPTEPEPVQEPTPEPVAEPEQIPVDTTFNREQARAAFKRSMGREPTEQELSAGEEAQREAIVKALQERMGDVREFARSRPRQPEPEQVPVEEPTPAPEPAPVEEPVRTPEPDQGLVGTPRRPVEETEPVVEEAPAPVVEEAPAPSPDQVLTQRPRAAQKEEPAPSNESESAPEAPTETPEAPKSEPDQTLARTPKSPREVIQEAMHEPAEPAPKVEVEPKDATAFERHKAAVKARAIELVKKMFSVKSVQDKVNESNFDDKRAIQRLKREDVAANTDDIRHAVDQLAVKKKIADQRANDNNIKELENWAKDNDIDYQFVTKAIEQKGLQKSMILGVNDIKTRATKLAVEAAKPVKQAAPEAEPATPVDWKDQANTFREGLKTLTPNARAKAAQMIEQAFKPSMQTGRPMNESNVHGLWEKIYNHESEVLNKAGKAKEAAEAKAKAEQYKADEEAISNAKKAFQSKQAEQEKENQKWRDSLKLGEQTDNIHSQIHKQLKEAGLTKEQAEEYAAKYMDENFGVLRTPMNDVSFNSKRRTAIEDAKKYGKSFESMNPAERVEALHGADETTAAAKEAFDAVKDRVGTTEKDRAQIEDDLSAEIVDRAEKAFRDKSSVADIDSAAEALAKAYGLDSTAAYSIRRYPKVMAKAQRMEEMYPNNPEVWLTQTDVDSLAKAGRVNADGMKAKITDAVLGKRYDSVKLLTEAEAETIRKRLDNGESLNIKIDKGRHGALTQAVEQAKPKTTIRKKGSKAGVWNRKK